MPGDRVHIDQKSWSIWTGFTRHFRCLKAGEARVHMPA